MAAGWIQDHVGYVNFFTWVLVATVPSFVITLFVARQVPASFGKKAT
jgi:PAT family beta-lactamase induction signal transducer AmpG